MAVIDRITLKETKLPNKWLILTAVMLGSLIVPLDSSIVNTILPVITDDLNTDISVVQWVPIVYLLAISCLIMINGRLGDMIGHRRIYIYGVAAFTITSLLCGASLNIWMLIVFRALQGFSASMILAVSFALVVTAFPASERGKALGIYAVMANAALAMGPTLGGLIAEHLEWRYVFYINGPIGVSTVIWAARTLPQSVTKPGQRLDFPGAVTAFIFLPALLLYFNRGEEWGWTSPLSLTMLALAVVFGVIFFRIELKSSQPMVQLRIFANRVFVFASMSYFFGYITIMALIFLTPFYLKFVLGYSIAKVGLVMVAYPIVGIVMAPSVGTLSDRIGTRVFAIGGMSITALGLFLLSGLGESASDLNVVLCLLIVGLGFSMFATPNNSTIMGNVSQEYLGITSGVLTALRYIGMAFGIAIAGAMLYGLAPVATSKDPDSFFAEDITELMNGLQWAYIAGAATAAAGAVTSILAVSRRKKD